MGIKSKVLLNSDSFNAYVTSIANQTDGKILVGGGFTLWNGVSIKNIVRFNSYGSLDTDFITNIGTGPNSGVYKILVQPDGKILVCGGFTTWNGATVGGLVRLNSNGTLDTAFNTNLGDGSNSFIYSVEMQSDNKIILVGSFSTWNRTAVGNIVRLNSDGTRDTAFTTNTGTGAASPIRTAAVQSDGKIILGGLFTNWNGNSAIRYIIRLNSNGSVDTSFLSNGPAVGSTLNSIVIQSDGKVLVGGYFSSWFNGTNYESIGRIVRLNIDGSLDNVFLGNIGTGAGPDRVSSIQLQSDGKIILVGTFSSFNGTTVGRIVRLNSDGTHDTTFTNNNGTGANNEINISLIQPDGKILVGGWFTSFNGITKDRFVILDLDGRIATSAWKNSIPYAKVDGTWKVINAVYNKVNGVWKQSFP